MSYLGTNKIGKMYLGSTEIAKAYLGSDLVYKKKSALPYDAEIEYLESTGTQYIDTGIIPDATTIVQFKFMNLVVTGNTIVGYPAINGDDTTDWRFFNYNSTAYFDAPGDIGQGNRIYGGTINSYVVYELELGNFYVKDLSTGTYIVTGTEYSEAGLDTIKLNRLSQNVFYYAKIFKNNNLVMDLIPVRIGPIGYMYDKVSGQLFGNSGTGNFVLGPDKHSLPYDAEIEYLEGTGTQWIDTGIVSSIGDSISITISTNDFVNTFLCGARKNSNSMDNSFFIYGQVNEKIAFASNNGYDYSSVDIQDGFIHTIEHKADGGYVDGVKVVSRGFTMSPSSRSYAVLTVNDREIKTNISACKLYGFAYYRNGVKIAELIPVRVGTTGYMYDKIRCRLFGNSGTGNFILGNDKN